MAEGIGCAICGNAQVSRRIDLTDSDVNAKDIGDYEVRGVLRGVLLCSGCITKRGIASLLNLHMGTRLTRGCVVQCGDNPPRHLRWTLPGGARMWTKTTCPCCHGRATLQLIGDVIELPESALRRGLREAFALLAWWRDDDDYDEEEAPGEPTPAAIEDGGVIY